MKKCHAVCLSHVPSGGAARAGAGFLTPPPEPQPGAADGTGGDTHGGDTYSKDAGSSSADSTAQPVNSQAADCSLAAAAARQQPEGGAAAAAKPSTPGELFLELGLQRLPETEYGWAAHPVAAAIVAAVAAREPKAERSLMHRYVAGAVRSFRVEASAACACLAWRPEHDRALLWFCMAHDQMEGAIERRNVAQAAAKCRRTIPAGILPPDCQHQLATSLSVLC